jgi:hypothetical protein
MLMSYGAVRQWLAKEPDDEPEVTDDMLGATEPLPHFESVTVPSFITISPGVRQLPSRLREFVRRAMRPAH